MIRHPPRSPLFPYTPLFRSLARRAGGPARPAADAQRLVPANALVFLPLSTDGEREPVAEAARLARRFGIYERQRDTFLRRLAGRSEEHTSELQSRQYLVCRL